MQKRISEDAVDEKIIAQTVQTLSSTGKKKRDMTKFEFDGKSYPKNQYIFTVIKNYAESQVIPHTTEFRKGGSS